MPSWSTSDVADQEAGTPAGDSGTSKLDSARKLLQQLFAEREVDDKPDQPEHVVDSDYSFRVPGLPDRECRSLPHRQTRAPAR